MQVEQSAHERAAYLVAANAQQVWSTIIGEAEKGMITAILENTNGNQSATATALGINRATLTVKIKLHDLSHLCRSTGEHNARHFAAKREGGVA